MAVFHQWPLSTFFDALDVQRKILIHGLQFTNADLFKRAHNSKIETMRNTVNIKCQRKLRGNTSSSSISLTRHMPGLIVLMGLGVFQGN